MSTDLRLAFDNLDARAEAAGGDTPLDRISLRDHQIDVEIGAFQEERGTTQRICFNIVVEVSLPGKPLQDDVDRILSYDTLTDAIAYELAAERLNLLETLAERIAERILISPRAYRVFVRIEKLDRGPGALGVEIVRDRETAQLDETEAEPAPHPTVVYLSNAALRSDKLTQWIDQLAEAPFSTILCVGAPDCAAPQSNVSPAQRRIDLLAIEQNAWVLAGLDPRCVVRGTRTELDWAVQNHQISVWAPSKIVLDSFEAGTPDPRDDLDLLSWFCGKIDAERLIAVGATGDLPDMPVKIVTLDDAQIV